MIILYISWYNPLATKSKFQELFRAWKILFSEKRKKNRHAETKERDFCREIDFWTPGAREGFTRPF